MTASNGKWKTLGFRGYRAAAPPRLGGLKTVCQQPVSLVHQHPLPFEPARESLLSWVKEGVSEVILGMVDGPGFLEWCARRGVNLVLHGHQHRPRLRDDLIGGVHGRRRITTVGCGTSLGIRRSALGYNLINWNTARNRWSATFYEGLPDGSGFHEIAVTTR